ncbi:MAG: hypothetical protein R3D43_01365 [Tepidamorphaceae bacterium]
MRNGSDVAIALQKIGDIRTQQGKAEEALEHFRESLRICRELLEREPANVSWQRSVVINLYRVGDALKNTGDTETAEKTYREGLELARALAANTPGNVSSQIEVVISLFRVANITSQENEKRDSLQEALAILEPLEKEGLLNAAQKDWPDVLRKMLAENVAGTNVEQ